MKKPNNKKINNKKEVDPKLRLNRVSLSTIMTTLVIGIILFAVVIVLVTLIKIYQVSMEQSAITSSEQAIVQVQNTITNYTEDIGEIMESIRDNISMEEKTKNDFFTNLLKIHTDVVSVVVYDTNGNLMNCWSGDFKLKDKTIRNLSYNKIIESKKILNISTPHVNSLLEGYYPWVVTISHVMDNPKGERMQITMDIRFSNIANYIDDVGIGQHGYCFIMDGSGNIVYHPQQQLIYSGLKEENTKELANLEDGHYTKSNVMYTMYTVENCDWRVVGVSYVDELITSKVTNMIQIVAVLLVVVLIVAFVIGLFISRLISRPANRLAKAMSGFESDAENFKYTHINGTREIAALSDSFEHMVVQIQSLMEKVRQEEISLRKTELNALQSQINPHFLYNTLDSIAWMCEEHRSEEAVEMVSSLAKLFRISISKGHELITLEKELQHAESYLKIQKYRYKSQFSYDFNIDEACLSCLCNKITLQPIIENAIYHGLDMVDKGIITIEVSGLEEDIVLRVIDNGVGMTDEQCNEILQRETSDKTGIGIKNVNDRIKIYFGDLYGVTIKSELDVGTEISILIPKIQEDRYGTK